MDAECSHNVNTSSLHALAIVTICELPLNAGMARTLKDISERLKMLNEALDISAAELCRSSGIEPNEWSQFTNGKRRISLAAALKLYDAFGVTLDWTFTADRRAMPNDLALKLRAIEARRTKAA